MSNKIEFCNTYFYGTEPYRQNPPTQHSNTRSSGHTSITKTTRTTPKERPHLFGWGKPWGLTTKGIEANKVKAEDALMPAIIEIIIIGCLVASAAAIPGCFLILRRMAMMSDAISHSVLLGIVLMFFIVKELHSPWLIIAATITGLVTVALTESLIASKQMKKDAAIGLIFPLFFAIAIALISLFAGNIHLDQDAVILGEIAFAPFNRFEFNGMDLGPVGLWVMSGILLLNTLFIGFFYKELKCATFDLILLAHLGSPPLFYTMH